MTSPWNVDVFKQRVSEILDEGVLEDVDHLEKFLLSSVIRVGGLAKIDSKTQSDLMQIAIMLNHCRAKMSGLENPDEVDEFLKSRRSYIDPQTLVIRGWLESEISTYA